MADWVEALAAEYEIVPAAAPEAPVLAFAADLGGEGTLRWPPPDATQNNPKDESPRPRWQGVGGRQAPSAATAGRLDDQRRIAEDRPADEDVAHLRMLLGEIPLGRHQGVAEGDSGLDDPRQIPLAELDVRLAVGERGRAQHRRRSLLAREHQGVAQGVDRRVDVVGVPAAPLRDDRRPAGVLELRWRAGWRTGC